MGGAGEASAGGDLAEMQSKLTTLQSLLKDILKAETDNAEIRLLRKALAEAFAVIDAQARTILEMRKEIDEMKRKLAYYESENMSTSTLSLYNAKRARFRKRRGEDPSGGPGEKARRGDGDGDGDGKRAGPPLGHEGVSHHNKATLPPLYYFLKTTESPCCGAVITMLLAACKMVHDLDGNFRVQSAMCVAERGACTSCRRIFKAETPFLEGTSLGPVLLAVIMIMFSRANTDQGIADMIRGMFGFEMGANTVYNARRAVSGRLQEGMIALIMRAIQLRPGSRWTRAGTGAATERTGTCGSRTLPWRCSCSSRIRGRTPCWTCTLRGFAACQSRATGTRGTPILLVSYSATTSTYCARPKRWQSRAATRGTRQDMTCCSHSTATPRGLPRRPPFTRMTLARRAYKIAASYKDKKMQTHLPSAIPHLFTFRAHSGMSPHSNDVEREIRDGIIPQRNVRHTTMTAGGRALMSTLLTFTRTCRRQGMSPGRALLEYLLDGTWNIFERAKSTPYSLVNPDGSRHSVFAGPGPPAAATAMTLDARQDQAAAAHTVAA